MKAFLLAGGYGRRLKPLTDTTPKCLIQIGTRPMLGIWLDTLMDAGVTQVLVNVTTGFVQVQEYLYSRSCANQIAYVSYEPEPLGNAGTVKRRRSFVDGEPSFWVVSCDTLTNLNLREMWRTHQTHVADLTMAVFPTDHPQDCGIVTIGRDQAMLGYLEKPDMDMPAIANAGIYLARPSLFAAIPDKPVCDFGYDVLPSLVGRAYVHPVSGYVIDMGTPEGLERARAVPW